MKNIYVLKTDKPSRLCLDDKDILYFAPINGFSIADGKVNIYITSDEEIKVGDWFLYNLEHDPVGIRKCISISSKRRINDDFLNYRDSKTEYGTFKIVLTTDPDLIKDGVQPIDDEFLQWFVSKANDSGKPIDIVEVVNDIPYKPYPYEIIIPKEEKCTCKIGEPYNNLCCKIHGSIPKEDFCDNCNNDVCCCIIRVQPIQETLEEIALKLFPNKSYWIGSGDTSRLYDPNERDRNCWIEGVKWQAERMYSELFEWLATKDYLSDKVDVIQKEFEQFKKK